MQHEDTPACVRAWAWQAVVVLGREKRGGCVEGDGMNLWLTGFGVSGGA